MSEAVIAGAAESPYTRHPDPETTGTESLLADAFLRALEVAGVRREEVDGLGDGYNRATRDHLAPIPVDGPNTVFALLTQRHMAATGLAREDYGRLVVAQRAWATGNPLAVYREPLTLEDYLAAPVVAEPLG